MEVAVDSSKQTVKYSWKDVCNLHYNSIVLEQIMLPQIPDLLGLQLLYD